MHTNDTLIKSSSFQKTLIEYLNTWEFLDILSTAGQKILAAHALSIKQTKFRWTWIKIWGQDNLIFSCASSVALGRAMSVETETQQILDGLPWHFVQTFMVLKGWSLLTVVMPWVGGLLAFPLAPPEGPSFTVRLTVVFFLWNVSATIGLIVYKHSCSQRMYPDDFGDPLTFQSAPSSDQNFNLSKTSVYDQILAKRMPFSSAPHASKYHPHSHSGPWKGIQKISGLISTKNSIWQEDELLPFWIFH